METLKRIDRDEKRCVEVPHFDRLTYFYGQMLTPHGLRREQEFFREKLKLHNRCLHGSGVVCGLDVEHVREPKECPPGPPPRAEGAAANTVTYGPSHHPHVRIECGLALDCEGNELVVRRPLLVDLWSALPEEDRRRIEEEGAGAERGFELVVSLCYCELPLEPSRPVVQDVCGAPTCSEPGLLRDAVRVEARLWRRHPERRRPCRGCCDPCDERCVPLARISGFSWQQARPQFQIHDGARRVLPSAYEPTVIASVNWKQGAIYHEREANVFMKEIGATIRFSREVWAETILEGVFDVCVFDEGELRLVAGTYDLPDGKELVREVTFTANDDEYFTPENRVVFVLRGDFVLDACCQPVDADHVGGRVHYEPDGAPEPVVSPKFRHCHHPPGRRGPWRTGDGRPGGTFESWFKVKKDQWQPHAEEEP